jgi:predicted enzyme related to lactoylglutathione lyase
MDRIIKTVIYPVKDIARAKNLYQKLLRTEPYANQSYYVGFRIGDMEIGLDPNGHDAGMTPYFNVDDIKRVLQSLVDEGASIHQDIKDVGGGKLTAILKDTDGNIIGLVQG